MLKPLKNDNPKILTCKDIVRYSNRANIENLTLYLNALRGIFPVDDPFLWMKLQNFLREFRQVHLSKDTRTPLALHVGRSYKYWLIWIDENLATLKRRGKQPPFSLSLQQLENLILNNQITI